MRKKGFTLIELVIVLAIAGILIAVAVPWFSRYLDSKALQTALRQVEADLRNAQQKAGATSISYKVTFTPGETKYSIYQQDQLLETKELQKGIMIQSNTATNNTIIFNPPPSEIPIQGGTITLISPKGSTGQVEVSSSTGKITVSP